MQLSTSNILGIPGVALFDNTNEPDFNKTVLLIPLSLMCSFIFKINGDCIDVASDIFNHLYPESAI